MTEKRVTVDFDSESYYLDGEYWESWDNFGEEMADAINKLLEELNDENDVHKQQLKTKYIVNKQYEELQKVKEENEQLKQEYLKLKHRHSLLHDECLDAECEKDSLKKDVESLEKENEQLKQFQDRVFSWIDMHLQRLPTLRDDEFESDNEFSDPSLYSGAIQILETMKRELKGGLND